MTNKEKLYDYAIKHKFNIKEIGIILDVSEAVAYNLLSPFSKSQVNEGQIAIIENIAIADIVTKLKYEHSKRGRYARKG